MVRTRVVHLWSELSDVKTKHMSHIESSIYAHIYEMSKLQAASKLKTPDKKLNISSSFSPIGRDPLTVIFKHFNPLFK